MLRLLETLLEKRGQKGKFFRRQKFALLLHVEQFKGNKLKPEEKTYL